MGKYTHLRHKLPTRQHVPSDVPFEQQEKWLEKVRAWREEFLGTPDADNANPVYLSREFNERTQHKKQLEEEISLLNIELGGLSQMIVEALESNELQKINLSTGGYVTIEDKPRTKVVDRLKIFQWIKKNKMQDILTFNSKTIEGMNNTSLLEEENEKLLRSGKGAIPGTEVWMQTKAVVRLPRNGSSGDE